MATTKHRLTLTEITERMTTRPTIGAPTDVTPVILKEDSIVYQQHFEDLDVNALIRELNKTKRRRKVTGPGLARATAGN